MAVLCGIWSVLLLVLYLRERAANRGINREVLYIKERLTAVSDTKESGYILVPSDNKGIRELSAQLNRLLEVFYRQEADYRRAKQAMEEVLTNIAHDLRTPLTVLKGYSEILKKEMSADTFSPQVQDRIEKIDAKADELVATINDYFTMSKIESGDMRLERQRVNMTQLCREVMLDYYDILEEAQFEVAIRIEEEPVYVCGDADALRRILKNLTDNAVKHGGAGRYLGICLRRSGGCVLVEMEDHGPGIAAKDREQIFFRNYTTAGKGAGSGLGLTIARNLALRMDGDLQAESVPGIRTVFTLRMREEL